LSNEWKRYGTLHEIQWRRPRGANGCKPTNIAVKSILKLEIVHMSLRSIGIVDASRKLADQMAGPFPTIAREGNAYRLQPPSGINVHPVINPEYLRKDPNNPLSGQTEDPQPPIEINGENEWEVEKIPASRKRGRKLQYRASWVGHDPIRSGTMLRTSRAHQV
jgi:hypothetical protein